MKLIASDNGVKEITLDGSAPLARGKDGTFDVPDSVGRGMLKGSEFGRVGTTFRAQYSGVSLQGLWTSRAVSRWLQVWFDERRGGTMIFNFWVVSFISRFGVAASSHRGVFGVPYTQIAYQKFPRCR
jgi:hypothetical protein